METQSKNRSTVSEVCACVGRAGNEMAAERIHGCNFPGQPEIQPLVMGQIPLRVIEIPEPTLNVDTLCCLIIRMFLMRFLYLSEDIL